MSDMLVTLLHACTSSVHWTKKSFYFILFYFIFGHQTWSLSNSLALFLSLTHSQTLSIFSFALSICSISWPIYYESVRLMLLEAHQLVSFSLSWPDTAVSFFTLNVKIPQWFSLSLSLSLSLTVKHSWSSVLFSVSQTGAAQSLSASLSPFLGKKKIFKCLFILNLFIYLFFWWGRWKAKAILKAE